MLVVNPTPLSLPLNTANLPTESVESQNRFAERIPESESAFESSNFKGTQAEQKLSDADRAAKSEELREQIFGPRPGSSQSADTKVVGTKEGATEVQAKEVKSETDTKQAQANPDIERQQRQQEIQDQATIRNLAAIDRRVKAHEQAHASVGGVYAGSPSFTYKTGPNGVRYAVAGEVPIDTSAVPGSPQATLRKAQQVARAALAPADPSSTDRRIASSAQALATRARFEIARLAADKLQSDRGDTQARINGEPIDDTNSTFESGTSFAGGKLHAALRTDATEQVGGQVSSSA